METMKDRLRIILGDERLARLEGACVLVFGCGGVGSSCVEALARGGVGTLLIVDKDVVAPSNINRQAIAFESTVGQRKVDVMAAMIADISPSCRVFAHDAFVLAENLEDLYDICLTEADGHIDYVVDAIDTVSTKLALAALAQTRGFELISSMGGAKKIHPECLRIGRRAQDGQLLAGAHHAQGVPQARHPPPARALFLRRAGAHRRRARRRALGAHRLGHRELHATHHGSNDRRRGPTTYFGSWHGRRRLRRTRHA